MAGGPNFLLIQTSISLPNRAVSCPPAGCYRLTNRYRHPAKIFPKTSLGDRFNQTIECGRPCRRHDDRYRFSTPELVRTEIANAVRQTTETGEPISAVDRFIFA